MNIEKYANNILEEVDWLESRRIRHGFTREFFFKESENHSLVVIEGSTDLEINLMARNSMLKTLGIQSYLIMGVNFKFSHINKLSVTALVEPKHQDQKDNKKEIVRKYYYSGAGIMGRPIRPNPATGIYSYLKEADQLRSALEDLGFPRYGDMPKRIDNIEEVVRSFLVEASWPSLHHVFDPLFILTRP